MAVKSKTGALSQLDNLMDGIEEFIGNNAVEDEAAESHRPARDTADAHLYSDSNSENLMSSTLSTTATATPTVEEGGVSVPEQLGRENAGSNATSEEDGSKSAEGVESVDSRKIRNSQALPATAASDKPSEIEARETEPLPIENTNKKSCTVQTNTGEAEDRGKPVVELSENEPANKQSEKVSTPILKKTETAMGSGDSETVATQSPTAETIEIKTPTIEPSGSEILDDTNHTSPTLTTENTEADSSVTPDTNTTSTKELSMASRDKPGLISLKTLTETGTLPGKEASSRAERQGLFSLAELSKSKKSSRDFDDTQEHAKVTESPVVTQESVDTSQDDNQFEEEISSPKSDESKTFPVERGSLLTLDDLKSGAMPKSLIDAGFKDFISSDGNGSLVTLKHLAEMTSEPLRQDVSEESKTVETVAPEAETAARQAEPPAKSTAATVAAEIEDLLREMQDEEPSKPLQGSPFIQTTRESSATKELRALLKDEPVYVYTSLAGGGYQMPSRTNRLAHILSANEVKFTYRDLGTDDEARQVWKRYGRGRSLPGVVRGRDDIIGNWEEMDEANEEHRVRELIYETL
ncbi:LAME_0E09318g1_1 [Lachancea meyersii CBS 8951]|uniref:LAME_0E09318g1_1 n=1 Tax=Lachancea meyersii CBS 8951 TaxID=1266667 RepID=A0A1G4JK39_9SACH|nr:LAME_0E09318g1_1 [Lachancea meyersii CBS 8951]